MKQDPPAGSLRARRVSSSKKSSEGSDAWGVAALVGTVLGTCSVCLLLPALAAGVLTVGTLVGLIPWAVGGVALLGIVWGVRKWSRARRSVGAGTLRGDDP